ncbi:MAG: decaprenyl-phosphate phosphoribosyltransferase [Anaerolineales bacterium]
MFKALIKTMRPRQWSKNIFVFAALVFDKQLFHRAAFLETLAGFFLFCLISSSVYIFNDIVDIEADRQHPEKKKRPIPAGELPLSVAWIAGTLITVVTLVLSYIMDVEFAIVVLAYFLLNLAYSRWLKHIPIIDVLVLAVCFVLRVEGGVTLIDVQRFSPWIYIVMTLLALYLGFGKRRAELALLAQGAGSHRKVFEGYTIPLLDQYILIVSGTTIVAYSLYTFTAPNVPANHSMMLTIPFVLYAIFRYLYLVQIKHAGGAPEEILLSDRPLQIAMFLWALAVLAVFYLSPA